MLRNIYVYIKYITIDSDELNIIKQNLDKEVNLFIPDDIEEIDFEDSLVITDVPENDFKMQAEACGKDSCEVKAAGFNTKPGEGYSYVCQTLDMGISYYRLVYARLTGEPFVVAETKNLLIREMTTKDLPELYAVYSTLEDCRYIEQLYDYDKELEFTKNYIKNMYGFFEYGLWLVFEKKSGELIGRAGIENREIDGVTCREIGYLIRRDMQHKGYAYEACQAILEYASDELGIQEMFAVIDKTNEPSRKLAQKLGFELYAQTDGGSDLYKFVFE